MSWVWVPWEWVVAVGLGSVRVGCCHGFGFREGGGGMDLGLGFVRVGCCRGFGFRGDGLLPWVWVP